MVQNRLELDQECSRIILPGYCEGDHTPTSQRWNSKVELGPKDLRDLPRWFEGGGKIKGDTEPDDYGNYNLEILAEINHAPRMSDEQIVTLAEHYRSTGADLRRSRGVPHACGIARRRVSAAPYGVSRHR